MKPERNVQFQATNWCMVRRAVAMTILLAALLLAGCSNQPQPQAESISPTFSEPSPERPSSTLTVTPSLLSTSTLASSPASTGTGSPVSLRTPTSNLNCTYTIYYWTNNPNRWMADNIIIGRVSYTKEDAIKLLEAKTEDPAAITLKQFFGAVLNILKGANSSEIEEQLTDTTAWLSAHPIGSEITETERQRGIDLANTLAAFNEGRTGPGLCADEPSTPTATPTPTNTATPTPAATDTQPPATRRPTNTSQPRSGEDEPVTDTPEPTEEAPTETVPATSPPATSPPTSQPATNPPPPDTPTAQPDPPTPTLAPTDALPTIPIIPTVPLVPTVLETP